MKRILVSCFVVMFFIGLFCVGNLSAASYKIATVDVERVFNEYSKTKENDAVLKTEGQAKAEGTERVPTTRGRSGPDTRRSQTRAAQTSWTHLADHRWHTPRRSHRRRCGDESAGCRPIRLSLAALRHQPDVSVQSHQRVGERLDRWWRPGRSRATLNRVGDVDRWHIPCRDHQRRRGAHRGVGRLHR